MKRDLVTASLIFFFGAMLASMPSFAEDPEVASAIDQSINRVATPGLYFQIGTLQEAQLGDVLGAHLQNNPQFLQKALEKVEGALTGYTAVLGPFDDATTSGENADAMSLLNHFSTLTPVDANGKPIPIVPMKLRNDSGVERDAKSWFAVHVPKPVEGQPPPVQFESELEANPIEYVPLDDQGTVRVTFRMRRLSARVRGARFGYAYQTPETVDKVDVLGRPVYDSTGRPEQVLVPPTFQDLPLGEDGQPLDPIDASVDFQQPTVTFVVKMPARGSLKVEVLDLQVNPGQPGTVKANIDFRQRTIRIPEVPGPRQPDESSVEITLGEKSATQIQDLATTNMVAYLTRLPTSPTFQEKMVDQAKVDLSTAIQAAIQTERVPVSTTIPINFVRILANLKAQIGDGLSLRQNPMQSAREAPSEREARRSAVDFQLLEIGNSVSALQAVTDPGALEKLILGLDAVDLLWISSLASRPNAAETAKARAEARRKLLKLLDKKPSEITAKDFNSVRDEITRLLLLTRGQASLDGVFISAEEASYLRRYRNILDGIGKSRSIVFRASEVGTDLEHGVFAMEAYVQGARQVLYPLSECDWRPEFRRARESRLSISLEIINNLLEFFTDAGELDPFLKESGLKLRAPPKLVAIPGTNQFEFRIKGDKGGTQIDLMAKLRIGPSADGRGLRIYDLQASRTDVVVNYPWDILVSALDSLFGISGGRFKDAVNGMKTKVGEPIDIPALDQLKLRVTDVSNDTAGVTSFYFVPTSAANTEGAR